MTLNGVMALFCVISANSGSFRALLRKSSRSLSHLLMSSCLYSEWTPMTLLYSSSENPQIPLMPENVRARSPVGLWAMVSVD